MIKDTAHRLYQEWLQTDEGRNATGGTKAFIQDWFALHNRRRYDEPLPEGVLEDRRKADELRRKVEEHDTLLTGLFKQMTASFGGLMKLDERLKVTKSKR